MLLAGKRLDHGPHRSRSRYPSPVLHDSTAAMAPLALFRAKLRLRVHEAHVRGAPMILAHRSITAAHAVRHLFLAARGLCSFWFTASNCAADFNGCTLACRGAPCGCVTAPPCSLRGGMGLGISACSPFPLPACIWWNLHLLQQHPCRQHPVPLTLPSQKTKRPGTLGVAGPIGLKLEALPIGKLPALARTYPARSHHGSRRLSRVAYKYWEVKTWPENASLEKCLRN